MPRSYGTTNVMPYATAPAVGQAGDEYWNTTLAQLNLSDGTKWIPITGGGGGGAAVPAWVGTISSPTIAGSPYTLTHNLGTTTPFVQLWDATTLAMILAQVVVLNANQIAISFSVNPLHNVTVVIGAISAGATPTNSGPWTSTITSPAANTNYPMTHTLNTTTPIVQLYDAVTQTQIVGQITVVSVSQFNVSFATAPPHNVTVVATSGAGLVGPPAANTYYLTYYQTIPAVQAGSPYTLTHNLNSTQIIVQLWDAVTLQMVQAQAQILDANHVQISVAQTMPNSVNVVVMIGPSTPAPVNPGDMASKSYVDARTPNLPAPVTSGTTIQSFTDAVGEVWVAKNGVNGGTWLKARDVLYGQVYRLAALNFTTTQATVQFDTVLVDKYGLWTPWYFVIPIPGLWRFEYLMSQSYATAGGYFGAWIINNVGPATLHMNVTANATAGPGGITVATTGVKTTPCLAGDQISIQGRAPATIAMQTGGGVNYFIASYVGTG